MNICIDLEIIDYFTIGKISYTMINLLIFNDKIQLFCTEIT